MLDAFSQSFKHFKDNFCKVVVKEPGRSYFYNEDGSTKFPFWLTDNPRRFKGMKKGELSTVDREVVEILGRFSNKLPTKGLVRVYLLVHPVVDLEGIIFYFFYSVLYERDNHRCLFCRSYGSLGEEKIESIWDLTQGIS